MILYAFVCSHAACGHSFDDFRRAGATSGVLCPSCGSDANRVFTPPQSAGLAPWMRQEAEEANVRNREYLASPEARKLMKEDRLVPCGPSTGGN